MFLAIIFSILSATFSVSSTTTVEPTGTCPASSSFLYERSAVTGQKGQMTAGNATRLELRGWDGCTIKSVELQMRSNANSGVGSLTMKIGIDTVWSIYNQPFNEEVWAGTYTTEWVSIAQSMTEYVSEDDCIEIIISATENSLYINSYTIYYEPAIPKCYTVSFNTGLDTCPSSIQQNFPEEELILPTWQDTACWYFIGWTEKEILENQVLSPIIPAGNTYVPRKDIQLWAVYTDVKENRAIDYYMSGTYLIACHNDFTQMLSGSGMAMLGTINNDMIKLADLQMDINQDSVWYITESSIEQMFYNVEFYDDSTLYLNHFATYDPIGYKAAKLYEDDVPWNYNVLDDGSIIFYYTYNKNQYALYFGRKSDRVGAYAQILDVDKWTSNAMWLFPVVEKEYTSWPFGKFDAVDNILVPQADASYRFGIYEIHINNGQKLIYIHP